MDVTSHNLPPRLSLREDPSTRADFRNLYAGGGSPSGSCKFQWLGSLFDDQQLEETSEILAGASQPNVEDEAGKTTLTEQIHDCDRRLGQYQAVLDEGAHAEEVARWIAQVHRERANLQAQLGHTILGGKLTSSQVRALIDALRDIVTVLAEADPQDRADLYRELVVSLTCHPEGPVSTELHPRGLRVRVGGLSAQDDHPAWRLEDWET
jgi:hypothetical protein